MHILVTYAGEDKPPALSVQLDMALAENRSAAVAFIKRGAVLDLTRPLANQLHMLNIGDGSPSEVLHSYIHNAVSPFFNAYASKFTTKTGSSNREAKTGSERHTAPPPPPGGHTASAALSLKIGSLTNATHQCVRAAPVLCICDRHAGIPAVRKKMAELEVSLQNLQQNMDIPTVVLQIHPMIQAVVSEVTFTRPKTGNASAHMPMLKTHGARWFRACSARSLGLRSAPSRLSRRTASRRCKTYPTSWCRTRYF